MNLVAKVEFMKMSTPQEKAECVFLVYRDKVRSVGLCKRYRLLNQVRDINDLQHVVTEAIDTVTVDMLARTWKEIE